MRLKAFVVAVLLPGCAMFDDNGGQQPTGGPTHPGNQTVRQTLSEPRTMLLGSSTVEVTAHRMYGGADSSTATLDVKGGSIEVQADTDGTLELISLNAEVGDIILSPSAAPPDGLHLTNVKLELAADAVTTTSWTNDGSTAAASATVTLNLDWAIMTTDGTVIPLAPVRVKSVPISVAVARDAAGKISLQFIGQRDGTFFEWTGQFSLSDLKADLSAAM